MLPITFDCQKNENFWPRFIFWIYKILRNLRLSNWKNYRSHFFAFLNFSQIQLSVVRMGQTKLTEALNPANRYIEPCYQIGWRSSSSPTPKSGISQSSQTEHICVQTFAYKNSYIQSFVRSKMTLSTRSFIQLKTLTCTFWNAESLQRQKLKCQKLLLSQKLNFVDFRHFKTCAFRVLSMVKWVCRSHSENLT